MSRAFEGKSETDSESFRSRQGDFARRGKVIKITEDVREYAAEQGLAEEEALESGMEEIRKEFIEKAPRFTFPGRVGILPAGFGCQPKRTSVRDGVRVS